MELRRSWFPNLEYTSIRCSRRREDSQSFHPHRRNIRARCHAIQQLFPVNSMGRGVLTRKPREIKHYRRREWDEPVLEKSLFSALFLFYRHVIWYPRLRQQERRPSLPLIITVSTISFPEFSMTRLSGRI